MKLLLHLSIFISCRWAIAHSLPPEQTTLLLERRAADADNETLLEEALAQDGFDLPPAPDDYDNATQLNLTDAPSLNSTNTTISPAPSTSQSSLSPSTTTSPTPTNTTTDTLSLSPSITNASLSPSLSPSTLQHTSTPTTSPLSTPKPTYSPLPIQPINILVLTDVHSWVLGHGLHEPNLNADYGDVLSLHQRLSQQITSTKLPDGTTPDLYFVTNGDFIHGTILGDDPPLALGGILERMPYDVVTLGNHDVMSEVSVEELMRVGGLKDVWGEKLVTSNLRVSSHDGTAAAGGSSGSGGGNSGELAPIGNNYKLLKGNQGTILTLGFLYNMSNDEAAVTVETVQTAITQDWFTSLFKEQKFDAILVLAHMNVDDELITFLHLELRKLVGTSMVIQFITGHTHIRSYVELDEYSTSFEAGRYLDTIGFVSFDLHGEFQHVFVDANKESIGQVLGMGVDEYPTQDGMELSAYIDRTVEHAGGNRIVGCSPMRYRVEGYLNETDSLLRLYLEEVMPISFLRRYSPGSHGSYDNVFIQRLDWFVRYDLFPGVVTLNDVVGVIPEDYAIVSVSNDIRGKDIMKIILAWNDNATFLDDTANVVGMSMQNGDGGIDKDTKYALFTLSKFGPSLNKVMNDLNVFAPFSQSSHVVYNGERTVRTMWVDFIRKTWPYDGNNCECLKNDTCGNFTTSEAGNDNNTSWPIDQPSSTSKTHGSTHISLPSPPNPPNSETSESRHQSSRTHPTPHTITKSKSNNITPYLFIAVALAGIFYTLRKRRQGYTAAREATRNNDLELRVTRPPGHGDVVPPAGYGDMNPRPGGGYSSPSFSRGDYV